MRTFADLRIDDDPGSSLAEHQRYSFDVDNHARLRLFENGRAAATAFLERLS